MQNINNITLWSSIVALGLIFVLTFSKGTRTKSTFLFGVMLLGAMAWVYANIRANYALFIDESSLLFWTRMSLVGPLVFLYSLLLFVRRFPFQITHTVAASVSETAVGLLFAIFLLCIDTNLNVKSVDIIDPEKFVSTFSPGPFYQYTFIIGLLVLVYAVFTLRKKWLSTANKQYRGQILSVMIGVGLLVLFASLFSALLPLLGDSRFINIAPASTVAFAFASGFAIFRHQLFDIRLIIKRIFIYTLLLGFVFGVYSIVIQTLSAWLPLPRSVADFAAALLVAFSFDPVRRAIARWTEKYLFVSEYKADEVIKGLTDQLAGVVDLDEALRLVVRHITDGMGLERGAAIVKRAADNGEIQLHVGANVGVPAPTRLIEEAMLPIFELLGGTQEAVMTGQLRQQVDGDALTPSAIRRFVFRGGRAPNHHLARLRRQTLEQLDRLKLGAAVPVVVNKKPICILLFGDQQSGDIYFTEDVKFLQLVASTTANAIEKARFYEEDQIKSEFVSIASHELLTPTAAIEGYLSMILVEKMGKVDKQAEQYLQVVYKSAQRLATLVKDLLAMSRIEGNRIQIVPKYFDLGALINEQVMTIMPRASEKSLKLAVKSLPKGELKSYADPEKVTQVFINLVSNAIKYTKKGSVTVNVLDKGTHWEISVTDTGIGMAPADRQHLFEKFYRIQNDNTMGITGTGLGLYISKSLITMMGGDITVSSELGKGSTFAFTVAKKPNHAT